jgi:hypothetical protein
MVGLIGDAQEEVETGPLIAHTDTSWTFGEGNVLAEPGDSGGGAYIPLPPGYATCEAAGFVTYVAGLCSFAPAGLNGTLTGDVVLSLSDVPETSGGFSATFDLTGPVTFSISSDLANVAGVSAGPYFGSLTVEGVYLQDISGDGQAEYAMNYHLFEVSGVTVPEPSTLLLLASVLGIVLLALASRRRA